MDNIIRFTMNLKPDFHKRLKAFSALRGLSIKDYIVSFVETNMKGYELRDENGFTPEQCRELDEAIEEAKDPANLSPGFDNAEDLIAYLHRDREK